MSRWSYCCRRGYDYRSSSLDRETRAEMKSAISVPSKNREQTSPSTSVASDTCPRARHVLAELRKARCSHGQGKLRALAKSRMRCDVIDKHEERSGREGAVNIGRHERSPVTRDLALLAQRPLHRPVHRSNDIVSNL